MQLTVRALPVLAMLLLAGCSSSPTTSNLASGPTLPQPNAAMAAQPATVTTAALPTTAVQPSTVALNDVSGFVDAGILAQLSANDKSQAASAQINALTFGRPGAPRAWNGDKGVTGSVTVGPYVRVNNIDCRDFTHTVTVAGTPYAKKGTACRDATGNWSVAG